MALKPSHLGSKRKPGSMGSASASLASMGLIGAGTAEDDMSRLEHRPGCGSETRPGLDQKLHLLDLGRGVERERDVDVQNVAERRSRADDAQAEAGVAEPARIELVD